MKNSFKKLVIVIIAAILLAACNSSGGSGSSETKLEGSLEEIIVKVQEALGSEIMVFNDPVDLSDKDSVKYNLGLDSTDGVKEALAGNAMISTHAYSTVLVRVEADADAQAIAKKMVSGVDLMKWICVSADDAQALVYGDLIYLVMLDSGLEDKDIQAHFDAFESVSGAKADTIVKR